MSWEWTPSVGVGPIIIGGQTPAELKLAGFRLTDIERDDGEFWTHYWNEAEGVSVIARNGRVTSAACHSCFMFRGRNLIGLTDAEARMQFRDLEVAVGEFPFGHTLEVDELGLELTVTDGRVSIASIVGPQAEAAPRRPQ